MLLYVGLRMNAIGWLFFVRIVESVELFMVGVSVLSLLTLCLRLKRDEYIVCQLCGIEHSVTFIVFDTELRNDKM